MVVGVVLVDGEATVRETSPVIEGATVRAAFRDADTVPVGRAYGVEIVTLLGRWRVGTVDLREAEAPLTVTLDAPPRRTSP